MFVSAPPARVAPTTNAAPHASAHDLGDRPPAAWAAPQPPLTAPKLVISLDEASQRFVQMLLAPDSAAVLRQYPDETQLAFSRGVSAYVQATRRAQTV